MDHSSSPNKQSSSGHAYDAKESIVDFEVIVKQWWIEGGRLVIPKDFRKYFPGPGQPVVIIDYEGRRYSSKMHSQMLSDGRLYDVHRIDAIKLFYINHPRIFPGDRLRVRITGKDTAVLLMTLKTQGSARKEVENDTSQETQQESDNPRA